MATTNSAKRKELEKFKRRMIREVARRLLQEKQPEDEVWSGLNTETGYDCQLLWTRMKSITLKKMRLMLAAEDRVDAIAKAARMSVTDWLLFDLVLVHENINFIGMDAPRRKLGELKPLTDLFSLVQKFNLQYLKGKELADAWTEATLYYNGQGHHVSPMLLQKRWYQLKQSTRLCFYNFWFSYRGNAKYFSDAAALHSPTMLQMAVARRFVEVVTKPLHDWDEMIQMGLIIPSKEFDNRLRPVMQSSDDNAPDIVVVEPVVETIEIDSDTETNAEEGVSNVVVTPVANTIVKTEPEDVDIEENLTPDKMDLLENSLVEDYNKLSDKYFDDVDVEDVKLKQNNLLENVSSIDGEDISCVPEMNDENVITKHSEDDVVAGKPKELATSNDEIDANPNEDIVQVNDKNIEDVDTVQMDTAAEVTETLPQIASVFGNVNMPTESQTNLDVLPSTTILEDDDDEVDLIAINDNETDVKPNISTPEVIHGLDINKPIGPETKELVVDVKELIDKTCEKALKTLVKTDDAVEKIALKSEENISSYGELPSYLNLVDGGIELVDDGIAYVDEEVHMKNKNVEIKAENTDSEDDEKETLTEESPKIDLKLLLYPVVYTTKLDHMSIADVCSHTVVGKSKLDVIQAKSKPISKNTVNLDIVKKESELIENNISDSEESYDQIISNDLRVKISSNLLQKPRSRNYNPIILCKNPDFNTRLKRLTVGFLSSSRNRMLLKYCKPLTIDVSKAFESKLVNGTIYLKPIDENVPREKEVTDTECSQQSSVIPSAMPAQSLIDNQNIPLFMKSAIAQPSTNDDCLVSERSRVINLPDISQVRRLNQRLLTAEVTPIQVKNNEANTPLSIGKPSHTSYTHTQTNSNKVNNFPSHINQSTNASVNITQDLTNKTQRPVKGSCNSQISRLPTICNTFNKRSSQYTPANDLKKKPTSFSWKPKEINPTVSWLSKNGTQVSNDVLLTIDTLNKMLLLLSKEKDERELLMKKPAKHIVRKCNKALEIKGKDKNFTGQQHVSGTFDQSTQISGDGNVNDDVQIVSDARSNEKNTDDKPSCKPKINILQKRQRPKMCCWAQERILVLKNKRKRTRHHECPMPLCNCCCVLQLIKLNEFHKNKTKSLEQACQTIENVVQQVYSHNVLQVTRADDTATNVTQAEQDAILKHADETNSMVSKNISNTDESNSNTTPIEIQNEKLSETVPALNSDIPNNCTTNVVIPENPPITTVSNTQTCLRNPTDASINVNLDGKQDKQFKNQSTQIKVTVRSDGVNPVVIDLTPRFDTHNEPFKDLSTLNLLATSSKQKSDYLCKCELNVAVDSPQRMFVIDASRKCPLHKIIAPKVTSREKQIFLTSSQISRQPSKSPIYLGKNKILLTNIKFPPGLSPGAGSTEHHPMVKIVPTLPLPTGVKLILLPNGELTYTIEPNVELDTQQLKILPEILEAVKQQLNSTAIPRLANTSTDNEVINLSDDETLNRNEETIKSHPIISGNDKVSDETNDSHQYPTNSQVIQCSPSTKLAIQDDQKSSEPEMQYNIEMDKDITPDQPSSIQNIFPSNNEKQILTTGKAIESNNKDKDQLILSEKVHEEEAKSDSKTDSLSNQTDEEHTIDQDSNKSKNILSDLMEMSGISADDVVSAPTDAPSGVLQSSVPHPLPNVTNPQQSEITVPTMGNLSEFSAITSFAELKYASMNNGLFFKCDFETGSIVPINVCIKKQTTRQPKDASTLTSTIDLTDDDKSVSNTAATTFNRSILRQAHSPNSKEITKAKPLKLFKSVHPGILRSFSTSKTENSALYIFKNNGSQLHKKNKGQPRKQQIKNIEATIDMVDSDCPMEEEYLDSSDSDSEVRKRKRPTPKSDDSSDEEPLSKIANRMKVNRKDDKNDNESNSAEGNTDQLTIDTTEPTNQNEDASTSLEQENVSFMLDLSEDEAGEDCILGV